MVKSLNLKIKLIYQFFTELVTALIFALVLYAFYLIKSSLLLAGTMKRNPTLLMIFLVLVGIGYVLSFVLCFFLPLYAIITMAVAFLISLYGFAVIYSYRVEISENLD